MLQPLVEPMRRDERCLRFLRGLFVEGRSAFLVGIIGLSLGRETDPHSWPHGETELLRPDGYSELGAAQVLQFDF